MRATLTLPGPAQLPAWDRIAAQCSERAAAPSYPVPSRPWGRARAPLTNSKTKSKSGKVAKTEKPLGRELPPEAAAGAMPASWRRPRDWTRARLRLWLLADHSLAGEAQWQVTPARGLRAGASGASEGGAPGLPRPRPTRGPGQGAAGAAQKHTQGTLRTRGARDRDLMPTFPPGLPPLPRAGSVRRFELCAPCR